MKAVIVDRKGKYAAALTEDGAVVRIPDRGYEIGERVELPAVLSGKWNRRGSSFTRFAAAAAAVLVLAGAGGGAVYAMPYGTVSVDAESSIEYTINRFDYVIGINAVDEEGEDLIRTIGEKNLKNHRVSEAVRLTAENLTADEIFFSAGTKNEKHSASLCDALESVLLENSDRSVHGIVVTDAQIEEAHASGMTAGQFQAEDIRKEELNEYSAAANAEQDGDSVPSASESEGSFTPPAMESDQNSEAPAAEPDGEFAAEKEPGGSAASPASKAEESAAVPAKEPGGSAAPPASKEEESAAAQGGYAVPDGRPAENGTPEQRDQGP